MDSFPRFLAVDRMDSSHCPTVVEAETENRMDRMVLPAGSNDHGH